MLVEVIPIYVNGKRRGAREIKDFPPLEGQLTIADAVDPSLPGRPKRIARLKHPDKRGVEPFCGPLYDPEIISMDEKGFMLRGFNIVDVGTGPPELRIQGWLVRPYRDGGFKVGR